MDTGLENCTYLFDFRDILGLLKENPNFTLTIAQLEDLVNFVVENIEIDVGVILQKISCWGESNDNMSINFHSWSPEQKALVRTALFEFAIQLWNAFNKKMMFDVFNSGTTSFPFVLTGIVGTNLILLKDNTISCNEVNIFG